MSRALIDLHPQMQPMAERALARLVERRLVVVITDTLRTLEEHQANLDAGNSWTSLTLHLWGLAIDVAPLSQYELHGANKIQWDASDPVWAEIGEIGKSCGLDWGGDWNGHPDPGHLEHPRGRYLSSLLPVPA